MQKIKDNFKLLLLIAILIIFVCFVVIFYYKSNNTQTNIKTVDQPLLKKKVKKKDKEETLFYVDIKGAVINEGVYKLKEDSRVIDVINAAGGLKDDADTSITNLSKKIFDEMFIIIYTKEEIQKYKEQTISTKEINDKLEKNIIVIDENNNANIKIKEKNTTSNTTKEESENKLININTATKEELLTLTGIGESKADSIISYREENGNFESIDDIKNVSGIGDALFEKIKDYITI